MSSDQEYKIKEHLDQLLVRIELDASKAGLSAVAIKNLQEDCKKVISKDKQFQI